MKFILTIILIFILVPPLLRLLIRFFLSNQISKAQQDLFKQQQAAKRNEGRVHVDRKPETKETLRGGEYVDYEEVKD
jgi:hypothetical protein